MSKILSKITWSRWIGMISLGVAMALFLLQVKKPQVALMQPTTIIQYIDDKTFAFDFDIEQWTIDLQEMQSRLETLPIPCSIRLILSPNAPPDLVNKLSHMHTSFDMQHSSDRFPLAVLKTFSPQDNVTIASPRFVHDLFVVTKTDRDFLEALLGLSLAPETIYLFSRLEGERFRVDPSLIIFSTAGFNKTLVEKRLEENIKNTNRYLQLLSMPDTQGERLEWLKNNPSYSILESGFFSQIIGEQFWQDQIWDLHSRYIIEPLHWPTLSSAQPYAPIIPYAEIKILFPHAYEKIAHALIAYNDSQREPCDSDKARQYRRNSQESFQSLSFSDQQKFATVYGTNLVEKMMVP